MHESYKTLYKLNTNGSIQRWSIFIGNDNYWTETGKYPNGKVIISAPTKVVPKVNRTLQEQILLEVNSKITKQVRKRYVENVEDIANATNNLPGFETMLAHKFIEKKKKVNWANGCAQPKLNGARCVITKDGMFTRSRKVWESCQHIKDELNDFFKREPSARLDGELFVLDTDFEEIISAVKKTADKASLADLELQKKIEYHIYDAPRINGLVETDTFESRQKALANEFKDYKHVVVVETVYDVNSEEEFVKLKTNWVQQGLEGGMLRDSKSPYESKRSNYLLKLKDFFDDEFLVTGINEGKGKLAGHAATFTCKAKNGETFDAKMKGKQYRLREIFLKPELVVGKQVTVRYQNLSADRQVPIFGVCVAIRDYE